MPAARNLAAQHPSNVFQYGNKLISTIIDHIRPFNMPAGRVVSGHS